MSRNRQALWILGLALLLGAAFALFARFAPWHAELAETNFQANLIRLQAFLFDPAPRAVLVGSSMSGRLVPSCFAGTRLAPLANLGLDGSGPLFGLDLVLRQPPSLVIVEENTLLRAENGNDVLLGSAINSPTFRCAKYLPILRAQWRPSSVLYTRFKLRSNNAAGDAPPAPAATPAPAGQQAQPGPASGVRPSSGAATSAGHAVPEGSNALAGSRLAAPEDGRTPGTAPGCAASQSAPQEPSLSAVREKLQAQIQALRARGSQVVLVHLPAGPRHDSATDPAALLGASIARELNVRRFDLQAECARRGCPITYTDGLHLTAGAAREVSRVLAELVAGSSPVTAKK